ncbi:hypothetical protein [Robiginitalea sediminis]|uniref:hypothetical protein n=1 Tax=Robiginitalea sediminis TaxID=1982593 RepID=UPI000B4B9882|nr:hypothetical protein [Robiginitalea sediminis]
MIRLCAGILFFWFTHVGVPIPPEPPGQECSVTATGWVHSETLGSFQATITVTGPCDATLAEKMRHAIAELRAGFK